MPCTNHAISQATSQGHGKARQGHGMVFVLINICAGSVPSDYHANFHDWQFWFFQQHADFHEGHGIVGRQGHGTACVNKRDTARQGHDKVRVN